MNGVTINTENSKIVQFLVTLNAENNPTTGNENQQNFNPNLNQNRGHRICTEWNLQGKRVEIARKGPKICSRVNLQGIELAKKVICRGGICKEWTL